MSISDNLHKIKKTINKSVTLVTVSKNKSNLNIVELTIMAKEFLVK